MRTLEALFAARLAWRIYGESMARRVWLAMLLPLAGGMALVLDQGWVGSGQLMGLLVVMLATAAWGVDNTLARIPSCCRFWACRPRLSVILTIGPLLTRQGNPDPSLWKY